MTNPPPELQGLTPELRFWRLIEERETHPDGSQTLTLACGHKTTQHIPLPASREYAPCPWCLHLSLAAEKAGQR
jgi:hypothetical protein